MNACVIVQVLLWCSRPETLPACGLQRALQRDLPYLRARADGTLTVSAVLIVPCCDRHFDSGITVLLGVSGSPFPCVRP